MLSIRSGLAPAYPSAESFFSPDEPYPEYRYESVSRAPNSVYKAVRDCFAQAGLDRTNFGTPAWNPLGEFVRPDSRVFVLCNFVQHALPGQSAIEMQAKCTHASVIRPVLDYLLIAAGRQGSIRFGNAPLQSCRWEQMIRQTGADVLDGFYRSAGEPASLADLRMVRVDYSAAGTVLSAERLDSTAEITNVDLGARSLLSGLDHNQFRVTNYSPERMREYHDCEKHIYVLNRMVTDADVLFSIPKWKAHEKVGITCALKGCVGAIAHKECLAHHRAGPPERGGDEYARDPLGLLGLASALHDHVQRLRPERGRNIGLRVADRTVQRLAKRVAPSFTGAWSGNDTAWRMSLDIARILMYYKDGALRGSPVRPHLVVSDGVIGGEGCGPLRPAAVPSGTVSFADNPVVADYASALLMGFNPDRLPIVHEALRLKSLPLAARLDDCAVVDGKKVPLAELAARCHRPYLPPPGWVGVVEADLAVPV